jgi:hypothetical protein
MRLPNNKLLCITSCFFLMTHMLAGILKVPGLSLMFAPAQDQHGNQIPLPGPNDLPQFVAVSYTATVTFQHLNMFCLQHAYHRQPHLFELIQEGDMQGVRKLTQEELQQRSTTSTSSTTSTESNTNAAQLPTAAQVRTTLTDALYCKHARAFIQQRNSDRCCRVLYRARHAPHIAIYDIN